MLPHRSDTSRGHLHPPTRPRLSLPPFASLFPSSFPLGRPSRAHQPHYRRGGFSRATAYAATFLGALAQAPFPFPFPPCRHPPVFATTRTPSLPSPLVVSLEDATAIVYASNLLTPGAMTLPPERRSVERGRLHGFLELLIVRSRANSTMAMCSRRPLHSSGARERRSREICPLAS